MIRDVPQGVFNYQSKALKMILIVCSIGIILCLGALAFIIGSKPNSLLILSLVALFTGSQLVYLGMNYKNSQLAVTDDAVQATGPTKKITRIRFDEIISVKFSGPGEQGALGDRAV